MRLGAVIFIFATLYICPANAQPFLNCDDPDSWSDGAVCRNDELRDRYFDLQRAEAATLAKSPAMEVSVVTTAFKTILSDIGRCKNDDHPDDCIRIVLESGMTKLRNLR